MKDITLTTIFMEKYMKNILEFLENNLKKYSNKTAFQDVNNELSFYELVDASKRIGSFLTKLETRNAPIAIYLDKSVKIPAAMFGITYSGNFYVIIDSEMPVERIKKIFSSLNPVAVITQAEYLENAKQLTDQAFLFSNAIQCDIDNEKLSIIRQKQIDTDPLYALYTSGSTGVPKGAVLNHRNVIAYINWFNSAFSIDENTVFGNQTPFYFSMSVSDIYSTISTAATLVIIPKAYFTFPIKLIDFLNEYQINTIYWVPSALSIVANFKLFDYAVPEHLKKVLFAGEVMPTKQLNYWINNLDENILYANLFGPTETTDICTYYVVDRKFEDDEVLPIGKPCDNCDVMIMNADGKPASVGEEGELLVRGSFLSSGYYNNPDKTQAAFIQNPFNKAYPELVYRTGDLVKENEKGEIIYICRKDYQIKHMGYRIELGEIETALSAVPQIQESACIYDEKNDLIIAVYSAKKLKEDDLISQLSSKLNAYLMPNKFIKLSLLPHNQNGKIDRKELMRIYAKD